MPRMAMLALVSMTACQLTSSTTYSVASQAPGSPCNLVSDCTPGYTCSQDPNGAAKICVALPPLDDGHQRGDPCSDTNPCDTGFYCGSQNICTLEPPSPQGGPCVLPGDCNLGLVCNFAGTCENPNTAGTAALGASCGPTDCQRPLVCSVIEHQCVEVPFSGGVDCSRDDLELGEFRVYFEVPKPGDANQEFYRLPFPSDIRIHNGAIDLSGHYSPGNVLGIDVTAAYLQPVQQDVHGFGLNQPVFLRTSGKYDLNTLCLSPGSTYPNVPASDQVAGAPPQIFNPNCTTPSLFLVNINNPSDPQFGVQIPVDFVYSRAAGHYICQNWLGVIPQAGYPLSPNTTYAVVATQDIHATWGDAAVQDNDFTLMLANSAPQDGNRPELQDAWQAMAPLRDYLVRNPNLARNIAGAAVFTTGDPASVAQPLQQLVYSQPQPTFDPNAMVVCNPNVVSPCDDGFAAGAHVNPNHVHQRGCIVASNPNFYVIQGRYGPNPVLQAGTRPYSSAADGGAIPLDAAGNPNLGCHDPNNPAAACYEQMCYSLTVPRGKIMPANGWPVIVFAHGTGGSFNTFLQPSGTTAPSFAANYGSDFAIISFDNVLHGWRQGNDPNAWSSDAQVPLLFFNIANGRASRDNVLQGAADLHTITRLVQNANLTTLDTGLVRFDPQQIYFVGHSQGTVIAPPYLTTNTTLKGTVLAGAGAELALSLLNKTQPINIAQLLGTFFGDRSISRVHPMMGLLAALFDPSDAIVYAPQLTTKPFSRPLFQVMGVQDAYAPDVTQQALAVAAGLSQILNTNNPNALEPYTGMTTLNAPQGFGAVQYVTDGSYDGHFVMFENSEAAVNVGNFLKTAVGGDAQISP